MINMIGIIKSKKEDVFFEYKITNFSYWLTEK